MKRKYPSGAQKNKMRAKAEQERAKLPKITSLFQQAAKVDSNVTADASAVRSPPGPATASNPPVSSESRQTADRQPSQAPSPATAQPASSPSDPATASNPPVVSSEFRQTADRQPSSPVTAEPASRASRFETG
ncbi:hypothetical protein SKAU_G00379510 [Synaphobranchus kaupii]|uniref:Uncharacterized protein n=1 Tax=Synaphobranchus kaupii TaxID=118154 RepID=A0A9Q1EDC6_SYNKA|nr:hypothetical protein SKAU_G00379510 [Synaphobranchus kaupii]